MIVERLTRNLSRRHFRDYYRSFMEGLSHNGFSSISVTDLSRRQHDPEADRPQVVLRHDCDVCNVTGNTTFHEFEQQFGFVATYYFRLNTVHSHRRLIEKLLETGNEVGYHYEETATIARENGVTSPTELQALKPRILELFDENVEHFNKIVGTPVTSVCSHGDWLNRRLKTSNRDMIPDSALRERGMVEAYSPEVMAKADIYLSDVRDPPEGWLDKDHWVRQLERNRTVYVLAEERAWWPGAAAYFREDFRRCTTTADYVVRRTLANRGWLSRS